MSETLLGLDTNELSALAESQGQPSYRGKQLAEWLYIRAAHSLERMTTLPIQFRAGLAARYAVGRSQVVTTRVAADSTFKLLLEMADGARVETVGLPYAGRFSCCVSSQVGCAMGCLFCATGMTGCSRNLTAGEIVDQVLAVREAAAQAPSVADGKRTGRVDHVTFMGMGEPLLNYEATLKALALLNSELGIGERNLTVSTSGIVPGIVKLASEKLQITLAVSLHAPNDRLREKLMPGLAKWPISELLEACREYIRATGRRVTLEYCLLDGLNESESHANELARILHGINCHVNLIPFNSVSDTCFRPSTRERVNAFREILSRADIQVTQRMQRGAGIDAACGQLRRREAGCT